MILIHGRGAGAQDILGLGLAITAGLEGIALIAPQAAGNSWYPARFLEPPERNEPALSSALGVIDERVSEAVRSGLPRERIVLAGDSASFAAIMQRGREYLDDRRSVTEHRA